MAIKWNELGDKVILWALIAFLGGVVSLHYKMVAVEHQLARIEEKIDENEERSKVTRDALISYWEHLE